MISGDLKTRDIAEFFIMPLYRKNRYGMGLAKRIFSLYKGKWEVRQLKQLDNARKFWLSVIKSYTSGDFIETVMDDEKWIGTVQTFEK